MIIAGFRELKVFALVIACLASAAQGGIFDDSPPFVSVYPDPCRSNVVEAARTYFIGNPSLIVLEGRAKKFNRATFLIAKYLVGQADDFPRINWDQFLPDGHSLDLMWFEKRIAMLLNQGEIARDFSDWQKLEALVTWSVERHLNRALKGDYAKPEYRAGFLSGAPSPGVVIVENAKGPLGRRTLRALSGDRFEDMPRLSFAALIDGQINSRSMLRYLSAIEYTGVQLDNLSFKKIDRGYVDDIDPFLPIERHTHLGTDKIIVIGVKQPQDMAVTWLRHAVSAIHKRNAQKRIEVSFPNDLNEVDIEDIRGEFRDHAEADGFEVITHSKGFVLRGSDDFRVNVGN